MIDTTAELVDCKVDDSANIHAQVSLIRAVIGRMCMIGRFSKLAYSSLGDMSYVGEYSVVINSEIGKFTSISWGVTIGPEEHDYTRVTNHSFLYSTKSFKLVPEKQYSPFVNECIIGNDVWIGCNSTILRGVKVGDGAVIGANSLVTKDVPPYAIVVGSPAKVLKYRFGQNIIEKLINLKWWEIPIDRISANYELFSAQPTLDVIKKILNVKHDTIS